MNRSNKVKVFSTIRTMNESAAKLCIDIASNSVQARGRFALCLSGGNTPKGLYTLLSMNPYRDLMPWKNTFIFWGDERCVPADDERNNAFMATEILLNKVIVPASNIFRIPTDIPPADTASQYEDKLKHFFGKEQPCFDLILLGLGENGHTASLFPDTAVLYEKSHWVKEVFVEDQQLYRVTMTAPLINKARHILFMITGSEKSGVLETVLTTPFLPEKYPAQLIRPEQGAVYWYADVMAASRLPNELINEMP